MRFKIRVKFRYLFHKKKTMDFSIEHEREKLTIEI